MLAWPATLTAGIALMLSVEKVPGAGTPVPVVSGTIALIFTGLALVFSAPHYLRQPQ